MERKCYNSCKCPRCLDRERPANGLWRDEASLNYPERNRAITTSDPQKYPHFQASYSKGGNRVRFENLPPRQSTYSSPKHFEYSPQSQPTYSYNPPPSTSRNCPTHAAHYQPRLPISPSEIERELIHKTNLLREQQRQLDDLRSRMVIPVLPEPRYLPDAQQCDNARDHHRETHRRESSPEVNYSDNQRCTREERTDRRGRSISRSRSGRRNSLNRNNNNNNRYRRRSSSETESFDSDDPDDDDDDYEDEVPLIRNDKTTNNNNALIYPDGTTVAGTTAAEVVVVEDRCCGTCCAIAALVTCGVLVVLIVYPILYLLKHSAIHF